MFLPSKSLLEVPKNSAKMSLELLSRAATELKVKCQSSWKPYHIIGTCQISISFARTRRGCGAFLERGIHWSFSPLTITFQI